MSSDMLASSILGPPNYFFFSGFGSGIY